MGQAQISLLLPDRLAARFSYDERRIAVLKGIPGSAWDPRRRQWTFPLNHESLHKLEGIFKGFQIRIDPAVHRALPLSPASPPRLDSDVLTMLGKEMRLRNYTHVCNRAIGNIQSPFESLSDGKGDSEEE